MVIWFTICMGPQLSLVLTHSPGMCHMCHRINASRDSYRCDLTLIVSKGQGLYWARGYIGFGVVLDYVCSGLGVVLGLGMYWVRGYIGFGVVLDYVCSGLGVVLGQVCSGFGYVLDYVYSGLEVILGLGLYWVRFVLGLGCSGLGVVLGQVCSGFGYILDYVYSGLEVVSDQRLYWVRGCIRLGVILGQRLNSAASNVNYRLLFNTLYYRQSRLAGCFDVAYTDYSSSPSLRSLLRHQPYRLPCYARRTISESLRDHLVAVEERVASAFPLSTPSTGEGRQWDSERGRVREMRREVDVMVAR